MYLDYFRLREHPFSLTPDPRFFYRSKQHARVLASLLEGLTDYGGVIQFTGGIGTGKTMLYRSLLARLPPGIEVALVLNPKQSPQELIVTICDELRVVYPYGSHSLKGLRQKLRRNQDEGQRTVLIIDEAQNLEMAALIRVLLLSELQSRQNKLMQIILIGQPELSDLLAKLDLRQLAQRITARYHLEPLSERETDAYVAHRLRIAGVERPLFTATALHAVYRRSLGYPRLINSICRGALIAGCTAKKERIEAPLVQQAAIAVRGETRRFVWPLRTA